MNLKFLNNSYEHSLVSSSAEENFILSTSAGWRFATNDKSETEDKFDTIDIAFLDEVCDVILIIKARRYDFLNA